MAVVVTFLLISNALEPSSTLRIIVYEFVLEPIITISGCTSVSIVAKDWDDAVSAVVIPVIWRPLPVPVIFLTNPRWSINFKFWVWDPDPPVGLFRTKNELIVICSTLVPGWILVPKT